MRYLLDTCVVSDFFKKLPNTIERFKQIPSNKLGVSTITIIEVEYGLQLNPERAAKLRPLWDALIVEIEVLPLDSQVALSTAILRAHLKSKMIGAYDCIIAGTALAHSMILVTSNMREFSRLENLISIEDWR
jgi:tRNA(fMet)-specific endonuclease VapC